MFRQVVGAQGTHGGFWVRDGPINGFYTIEGDLVAGSKQDLQTRVLRGYMVDALRAWLHQHRRTLQPLLALPLP